MGANIQELHSSPSYRAFIASHKVTFFFIVTMIFSWSIWYFAKDLPASHDWRRVILLGSYGPTLMAIVVSAILAPVKDTTPVKSRLVLFLLTFTAATVIALYDSHWWNYPLTPVEVLFDISLAFVAAWVIAGRLSPYMGVRKLLQPLSQWRVGSGWYFLALTLWPMVVLLANMIAKSKAWAAMTGWMNIPGPVNPILDPNLPILPWIFVTFLWFALFGGPLNEEVGWRGFALPHLQNRYSPLVAGIIVGAIWGLWHVPEHLWGMYSGGPLYAVIRIQEIPSGIIFAWLFNRTKGSLLPVICLHAARNTTSLFIGRDFLAVFILWTALSIVLVMWDKMYRRPSTSFVAGKELEAR